MSLYDLSPSAGVGAIQQTSPRLPFYGLIQHSGLPLVENPYILGGVVSVNWSEIEPASGVFNWEPLEQKIHPWVRSGKRVAIRIIVSSTPDLTFATPQIPGMKDIWGIQDEFNESIPSWLIGMGVKQCSGGPGMVHPHQYWNPIYLSALQRMIRELGTRYDGKPEVICVYAAVGC
ncbi:MAG TPA: beta-galactosidase, partial [Acidimicrobiales bacterium]|nr:beta-galactosidase [Acidimicrobiales bacterium]